MNSALDVRETRYSSSWIPEQPFSSHALKLSRVLKDGRHSCGDEIRNNTVL